MLDAAEDEFEAMLLVRLRIVGLGSGNLFFRPESTFDLTSEVEGGRFASKITIRCTTHQYLLKDHRKI